MDEIPYNIDQLISSPINLLLLLVNPIRAIRTPKPVGCGTTPYTLIIPGSMSMFTGRTIGTTGTVRC